jgi:predicted transposase/invertase (TIGR01784 family)
MPLPHPRRRTLDPKLDVVFKLLFAAEKNRDLLILLLTAVLAPESPITSAVVLNPEIDRENWDDKGVVLDIRVLFADGTQVDVEMQSAPHRALRERALYYWTRLFAGVLGSGQAYVELMPVIGVFILNFDELPTTRLHSIFEARERHEGYCLCPALELHFLELPKRDNPSNELEGRAVLNWCKFLAAETDEELEELAMTDPSFQRAKQALDDLSADPKARELARDREVWHFFHDQELYLERKAARAEGRTEGIVEGRKEGIVEGRKEGIVEGRKEGIVEGRKEGLVAAVRTACELIGIELTAEREAHLAAAKPAELEHLLESLRHARRWDE